MDGVVRDEQSKYCKMIFLGFLCITVTIVASLSHVDEDEHLTNEGDMENSKNHSLEQEADNRLLSQSMNGQNFGSAIQIPVMIPITPGGSRTDLISTQLPGMVSQSIRGSFYPPQMVNSYAYQGGNTLAYNTDLANGTGSLSIPPSAPIQPMTQVEFSVVD